MSLKKIKDWQGEELDVFKVTDASSVGAGLTRHEWQGDKTATQTGTTINADLLNEFQKSFVHSVTAEINNEGLYEIKNFEGLADFGVFEGLKMLIQIKTDCPSEIPKFKLNGQEYSVEGNAVAENLKVDKYILTSVDVANKKIKIIGSYYNKLDLGIETGTALEGSYLNKILGAEYKGLLSKEGIKKNNEVYFDEQTAGIVIGTGLGDAGVDIRFNDVTKFTPISNKSLQADIGLAHTRLLKLYDKLNETVRHVNKLETSFNRFETGVNLPTPQFKSGYCRAYNLGPWTVVEVELNIREGEKIPYGDYILLEQGKLPETFRPGEDLWQIYGTQ